MSARYADLTRIERQWWCKMYVHKIAVGTEMEIYQVALAEQGGGGGGALR